MRIDNHGGSRNNSDSTRCMFEYVWIEPEDLYVFPTKLLLNQSENREYLAEIMFETFTTCPACTHTRIHKTHAH